MVVVVWLFVRVTVTGTLTVLVFVTVFFTTTTHFFTWVTPPAACARFFA